MGSVIKKGQGKDSPSKTLHNLNAIIARIKAAESAVENVDLSGVDENAADILTNAGAISTNAAGISANGAALTTHKSSSDHDGRYYTESEVDALLTPKYTSVRLSAHQTSGVSAGSPVLFDDVVEESGLSWNTTTNQVTLTGGKTYELSGWAGLILSTAGNIQYGWYDLTNSAFLGNYARAYSPTDTLNNTTISVAKEIVTPSSDIDVELRINYVSGTVAWLNKNMSGAIIKEIK